METCKTTVARLKTQQFETRKNEEFRALGHEIERYGKQIEEVEDRELELMEKADGLKAAHAEAKGKLDGTQKLVDEELEKLGDRRKHCQQELEDLAAERKKLSERVDPDTLDLYERLRKNKGDVVVRLDDHSGMCGGCHMKVTTATLHNVRSGDQLAHCENCGRLLYWVD